MIGMEWSAITDGNLGVVVSNEQADYEAAYQALGRVGEAGRSNACTLLMASLPFANLGMTGLSSRATACCRLKSLLLKRQNAQDYKRIVQGNADQLSMFTGIRGWTPPGGWIVRGATMSVCSVANLVCTVEHPDANLSEVMEALTETSHF